MLKLSKIDVSRVVLTMSLLVILLFEVVVLGDQFTIIGHVTLSCTNMVY